MTTTPATFSFVSSAFNSSAPKDYFINLCCYGDDVVTWLKGELEKRGLRTEQIGQEDFGWYLPFSTAKKSYFLIIGFHGDGFWMGWIERRGFWKMLFRRTKSGIEAEIPAAIDDALRSHPEITQIKWDPAGS